MFFLISRDYQSSLSIHTLSLSLTKWVAFTLQSCGCTASFQSKRHLLHVLAWLLHQMDNKSCPGTENPIPVPPCPGFSSPGRPVPTFLATTVAIGSRAELHQKPWCPGGSRSAVLMASKENSGASSPPARL